MATNAAFLSAIQGMLVAGVTKHYDEPPAQLGTADLPAAFPLMPGGGLGEYLVSCMANNKTRRISYVICVEPSGQGTQAENYGRLAALMDNLETAIDALTTLGNFVEYDISTTTGFTVAGGEYWAVVAEITAREV